MRRMLWRIVTIKNWPLKPEFACRCHPTILRILFAALWRSLTVLASLIGEPSTHDVIKLLTDVFENTDQSWRTKWYPSKQKPSISSDADATFCGLPFSEYCGPSLSMNPPAPNLSINAFTIQRIQAEELRIFIDDVASNYTTHPRELETHWSQWVSRIDRTAKVMNDGEAPGLHRIYPMASICAVFRVSRFVRVEGQ